MKRATEIPSETLSRPFHGLLYLNAPDPTDESVGYYQSSAPRTPPAFTLLAVMPAK